VKPDMLAALFGALDPAFRALAEGPKDRAAAAFVRLELDMAKWAMKYGVTPDSLAEIRDRFRHNTELRRAVRGAVAQPTG
jgi:hypothetical protein